MESNAGRATGSPEPVEPEENPLSPEYDELKEYIKRHCNKRLRQQQNQNISGETIAAVLPWPLFPGVNWIITEEIVNQTSFILSNFREFGEKIVLEWQRFRLVRLARMPKLCQVLHMIHQHKYLEQFLNKGNDDTSLPFDKDSLFHIFGDNKIVSDFIETQKLALVQPLPYANRGHIKYADHEVVPLQKEKHLGSGGYAEVFQVRDVIANKVFANKVIRQNKDWTAFTTEIKSLLKLGKREHHHLVRLMCTYEHQKKIGLILLPVARSNLRELLDGFDSSSEREADSSILYRCFGCLTSALAFIHLEHFRHKDVKPENILIDGDNMVFSDFGLALDFGKSLNSITRGRPKAFTEKYAAPELAKNCDRGRAADVFSLGCVFLEVVSVLAEKSSSNLQRYLSQGGNLEPSYWQALDAVTQYVQSLEKRCANTLRLPLKWCQQMMQEDDRSRPKLHELFASIMARSKEDVVDELYFCAKCLEDKMDLLNSAPIEDPHSSGSRYSLEHLPLSSGSSRPSVNHQLVGDIPLSERLPPLTESSRPPVNQQLLGDIPPSERLLLSSKNSRPPVNQQPLGDIPPSERLPPLLESSRLPVNQQPLGDIPPSEYLPSSSGSSHPPVNQQLLGDIPPSEYLPSSSGSSRPPVNQQPLGDIPPSKRLSTSSGSSHLPVNRQLRAGIPPSEHLPLSSGSSRPPVNQQLQGDMPPSEYQPATESHPTENLQQQGNFRSPESRRRHQRSRVPPHPGPSKPPNQPNDTDISTRPVRKQGGGGSCCVIL